MADPGGGAPIVAWPKADWNRNDIGSIHWVTEWTDLDKIVPLCVFDNIQSCFVEGKKLKLNRAADYYSSGYWRSWEVSWARGNGWTIELINEALSVGQRHALTDTPVNRSFFFDKPDKKLEKQIVPHLNGQHNYLEKKRLAMTNQFLLCKDEKAENQVR